MSACVMLFAVLIGLCQAAQAQVYRWRDPQSGAQRFSNIAPAWYRPYEEVSGPRVVVTLGGKMIDDTALPLSRRIGLVRRAPRA